MRTDEEIKTDIYLFLKDSELANAVNGNILKTDRPSNSDKEDVIISVLDNRNGQIQYATINVNIYVRDVFNNNYYIENCKRCSELARIAADTLECVNNGYRFVLESQRIYAVNGKNEHVINNRLQYQFNTEII